MSPEQKKSRPTLLGFTLVEAAIVVCLVGMLAAVAIPRFGIIRTNARIKEATIQDTMISAAIQQLIYDTRLWPGNTNGTQEAVTNGGADWEVLNLNASYAGLVCADSTFSNANWAGPYISTIPSDPWGGGYWLDEDYQLYLESNRNAVAVGSYGPNGGWVNTYNDTDNVVDVIRRF